MHKFDGIIFDIDGTLAQTNELIFATFKHVAKKYLNREISNEEIIKLFGPTEDVILRIFMKNDFERARNDYYQYYQQNHKKMADIYPGITNILDTIKSAGIPLSIYTGKGHRSSVITLTELGIIDYFDMIVTGDDVTEPKPSRLGIDVFVNKYKLNRKNVLMIGDAPADIIAAQKAGVQIASVVWDAYAKDEVINLNKENHFNTVDELHEYIKAGVAVTPA